MNSDKQTSLFHFQEEHMAEVIEGYLRTTGVLCKSRTAEAEAEYGKYYGLVYQYTNSDLSYWVQEVDSLIDNNEFDKASDLLVEISKSLKEINPRLRSKH